jgi:hypothetical protein
MKTANQSSRTRQTVGKNSNASRPVSELKQVSRRGLLKSATAATALAVPYFVPASVLGYSDVPASDRVNLAIIGMGVRGNQLVLNIPSAGRVIAICDADKRKTDAASKTHAIDWKVVRDYRRLLDDIDVDGVIVSATDFHHVQAAILACVAGKDTYVEKPLALYIREGRALVEAARKNRCIVQTERNSEAWK